MDFVGLGCDRICEVSYKLIGHLIYMVGGRFMKRTFKHLPFECCQCNQE